MGYRKGYKDRIFEVLNEAKLDCIGADNMTLRQVLDLWWNSVRIKGNICYKNAYEEDPEYELGDLTEKDLGRKVYVKGWDTDEDGYPICFARFINEEEISQSRQTAIKIIEGLGLELYGEDYYKVEDYITSVLEGNNPSPIHIDTFKCYLRENVKDYLEEKIGLDEDDECHIEKELASDGDFIEEIVDELLDEDLFHGMELVNSGVITDKCKEKILDKKTGED